jgi:VWFA-related protein
MNGTGWLAFAALTVASAVAQSLAPQSPPPSQQTFRTVTVVVEVDAVVTDGKQQFVPGLTADDFDVLEDGRPQPIQRVYLVNGGTIGASSRPAEAQDALTPAPSTPPPRVFVLVFDQDHLQVGSFKRLKEAALSFLQTEFKSGDVGGIVVGSTMAGNKLTSDRETLLTAVRTAQPNTEKNSRRLEMYDWPRLSNEQEAIRIALSNDQEVLAQAVRRACQDEPDMCKKGLDPATMVMERAQMIVGQLRPAAKRTVMTLQALSSGLSRLPGRKSIILMTEGFFVEESWADLRQIVGAAARSNVRIYSLDARGSDLSPIDMQQRSVMEPGGGMPLDAYNTSDDGPNMLAVDTGGYAIRHTNKFADALAGIAQDASTYYVISYTPTNAAQDGSFRRISVRMKRGGLSVRARRGYLAVPTAPVSALGSDPHATAKPGSDPRSTPSSGSDPNVAGAAPGDAATPVLPANPSAATALAPVPNVTAAPSAEGTGSDNTVTTTGSDPNAAPHAPPGDPNLARASAPGYALRPDSAGRVDELARHEGAASRDGRNLASQGWDRYQKGDLEGAADLLGKAAADPNAPAWVRYAFGYSELGLQHPERATPEWEKVRSTAPEFEPVYLDLASAYMQTQNYGRALDVLKAASARWPTDPEILNAAGIIHVRRGALDEAINTFKKATEAKPDEALGYFNLGRTFELRYFKTRRYSHTEGRWLANSADVKRALASYEQYLRLGGPFEAEARQAIQNLQWVK